jgi:hypothetical protein
MCVKIVNQAHEEIPYDTERPLEDQIKGCEQIVVKYEPFDKSVEKLVQEMRRFINSGIDARFAIKVIHGNNLDGMRTKKQLQRATNDITLNEVIKLMVLSHMMLDRKLEEIATAMGQNK